MLLQAFFDFLMRLEREGCNDVERPEDSEVVKKLPTGSWLRVKVIAVTDMMAIQLLLYGSMPFADYPSLHSTIQQNQLANWLLCGPVTKVCEHWFEAHQKGIDRSLAKKQGREGKPGGIMGLCSRTAFIDTLHRLGINVEVKLLEKLELLEKLDL